MEYNTHTLGNLKQLQALPLKQKVTLTKQRIREWYDHYDGQVYISFSGGKDSTVLVDIATKMGYTDIPLVFCDTGLEYPEIREFVKTYGDRVVWLKPEKTFKQIITDYGYPFISKETSDAVYYAKKYIKESSKNPNTKKYLYGYEKLTGSGRYSGKGQKKHKHSCEKWQFLLNAPFTISGSCCKITKKSPSHKYERRTKRKAILGQLASESIMRTTNWVKYGCNGYNMKERQISNPLAFWTEQDVLQYIKDYNVDICSVYGEVVEELDSKNNKIYKTTKCDRTGCIFCGFGCHMKNDDRFVRLKETHPKLYDYIMKPTEQGGLGYREIIDWINENGNLTIKY